MAIISPGAFYSKETTNGKTYWLIGLSQLLILPLISSVSFVRSSRVVGSKIDCTLFIHENFLILCQTGISIRDKNCDVYY
ncbi:MAG: hypothetical protein QN423_13415, partial [Nitrososphaeraceae archaeon]|nr:hypothetical protein [Nitrososphaeraceae archaeon]